MKRFGIPLIVAAALLLSGCDAGRLDNSDGGGVVLTISDFDGLPAEVFVSTLRAAGFLAIGKITIESEVKSATGESSPLMDVEIESYEVVYSRADTGTITPPPLVQGLFGNVPVGGNNQYDNLRILTSEQIESRPLADLFVENGSFDKETGLNVIKLNFSLRFFGHTLSGEAVETPWASFTVEFTP